MTGVANGPVGLAEITHLVPEVEGIDRVAEHHPGRTYVYWCRTAGSTVSLVVKYDALHAAELGEMFEIYDEYHTALDALEQAHAPRPIAWSAEPPLLVTTEAPGNELGALVRDANEGKVDSSHATEATARAGAALAELHHRLPPMGRVRDPMDAAWRMYRRRGPVPERPGLVRNVTDFAVYNVIANDDAVYVIDPPAHRRMTRPHDDVAYFLMTLMNVAVGLSGPSTRRRGRRMYRRLAQTFVTEYSAQAGHRLDTPEDRATVALLAGYHARQWGRRRFRAGGGLRGAGLTSLVWSAQTLVRRGERPWLPARG